MKLWASGLGLKLRTPGLGPKLSPGLRIKLRVPGLIVCLN